MAYISASGRSYASFTKSNRSTGGGNCVEVGVAQDGTVAVRDSKDPIGPVIEMSQRAFDDFIAEAKTGAFDVDR